MTRTPAGNVRSQETNENISAFTDTVPIHVNRKLYNQLKGFYFNIAAERQSQVPLEVRLKSAVWAAPATAAHATA